MKELTKRKILEHAEAEYPRECCGLIISVRGHEHYKPCRNIAVEDQDFALDPDDLQAAEDEGDVIAWVHSHCGIPPLPTQADLVSCEITGLPWVIVCWPTGQFHEFNPSNYEAPLLGRSFVHGVLDCYALIRDYYKQELNIALPDFVRKDYWWLKKGNNLYMRHFAEAGFSIVPTHTLRKHDVVIMQAGDAVDPNHAAVYLGDQLIMHHVMKRLSCREPYGGYWQEHTICVVRHKDLCDAK